MWSFDVQIPEDKLQLKSLSLSLSLNKYVGLLCLFLSSSWKLKKGRIEGQRQVLWYTGVFWGVSVKIPPDPSNASIIEMQNNPVVKW